MQMMRATAQPQPPTNAPPLTALHQAAPALVQQAQAAGVLCSQSLARAAGNTAATAALLPLAMGPGTWDELLAMQGAIVGRFQQLQQGWIGGWQVWLQELGDLKRANTMSECLEQQFNLVAQVGALCKTQTSDLLDLQENIEVSYAYWLSKQARGIVGGT